MPSIPAFHLLAAIESALSILSAGLALAAFVVAAWKRSALSVQKEVTETYRACAEAERLRSMEMERRVHRLDSRVAQLAAELERTQRRLSAAHSEIEQFENIVRLLLGVRTKLPADTRIQIESILGEIGRGREQAASDLFAWDQTQAFLHSSAGHRPA